MSLYYACVYIFSRAQLILMTLSFVIKFFRFCIARFKFFDSQGRFMRVGRTPFGIQVSGRKHFPSFVELDLHH